MTANTLLSCDLAIIKQTSVDIAVMRETIDLGAACYMNTRVFRGYAPVEPSIQPAPGKRY